MDQESPAESAAYQAAKEQLIADLNLKFFDPPTREILEIDIERFDESLRNLVTDSLSQLKWYLNLPIITDKFGSNHSARRAFKKI